MYGAQYNHKIGLFLVFLGFLEGELYVGYKFEIGISQFLIVLMRLLLTGYLSVSY